MKSIVPLLEQELEGAVSVKDQGFLHRYITLMAENFVLKDENVIETGSIRSDIRVLAESMKQGFERVDRRFEAMDRRFDDMLALMDRRFEMVDKRFEDVNRRFEMVDKRFDDMNQRFDDVNKRFDDVNRRFTMMFSFITIGFVVASTLLTLYQFRG